MSSTNPKKRRGKKTEPPKKESMAQQLDKAEGLVRLSKQRAEELHTQWRAHMFRLSLLVLLVSFQQSRIPMDQCMATLKSFNQDKNDEDPERISGMQAAWLVVQDSLCEILGILLVSSIARFLLEENPTFASPFYLTATVMVPLQLGSYFSRKYLGCLPDQNNRDADDLVQRNFPVTLLFHAIVTAACWFMGMQIRAKDREVQEVLDLKEKLEEAQDTNKSLREKKAS